MIETHKICGNMGVVGWTQLQSNLFEGTSIGEQKTNVARDLDLEKKCLNVSSCPGSPL